MPVWGLTSPNLSTRLGTIRWKEWASMEMSSWVRRAVVSLTLWFSPVLTFSHFVED